MVSQDVLRRYVAAWTTPRSADTAALLDQAVRFEAGDMVIAGRDEFLGSNAFPPDATVAMIAEACQDDIGFQMYDATHNGRTVRIVEQLTVRDGFLVSSRFVTDHSAFMAFLAT